MKICLLNKFFIIYNGEVLFIFLIFFKFFRQRLEPSNAFLFLFRLWRNFTLVIIINMNFIKATKKNKIVISKKIKFDISSNYATNLKEFSN